MLSPVLGEAIETNKGSTRTPRNISGSNNRALALSYWPFHPIIYKEYRCKAEQMYGVHWTSLDIDEESCLKMETNSGFLSAKRLAKVRRRQAAALYWTLGPSCKLRSSFNNTIRINLFPLVVESPTLSALHGRAYIALCCSNTACRECDSVTRSCNASPNSPVKTSHDRCGIRTQQQSTPGESLTWSWHCLMRLRKYTDEVNRA